MKKVSLAVTAICLIWVLSGCGDSIPEGNPPQSFSNMESAEVPKETEPKGQSDEIQGEAEESNGLLTEQKQIESEQTEENRLEAEEMSILMKIGEETVTVTWEDNESVVALKELLREQSMSIQMSMYGGFEQVGSLGTSLPRDDKQTTTQAGDIVLYSGSQMVVFYGSNSWAYTRLGRITDKSAEELEELLGNEDVIITLELVS
ncbi:MAG: hypothetical protein HDR16_10025 [Lachnospiraceae bacterium]|nr:hypothetical protein [Lachnospiraceae bacterium]